jgi:hypothetical protein
LEFDLTLVEPVNAEKIGAMALWDRALTNTEVYTVIDIWTLRFSPLYVITPLQQYYFAEGDSITAGYTGNGGVGYVHTYPYLYPADATKLVVGLNAAVGGAALANIQARQAAFLACLPPSGRRGSRKFIASVLIGTNDFSSGFPNTTTYAADVGTYVDALNAGGFTHVFTGTVIANGLPELVGSSSYVSRTAYNSIITGAWGHGQGILDFAGNANLGALDASSNGTYFIATGAGAGSHPEDAGQAIMKTIITTAVNAIL